MQISCPQCASSYELDERVLPPGGAPVQCTQCSHVFTALPASAATAEGLASAPSSLPSQPRPAHGTTRIFGRPPELADPLTGDEPPPPRERTQIFGKVPASPAAKDPLRITQMFGDRRPPAQPEADSFRPTPKPPEGGEADAPGPAPKPERDAVRTTQIFGSSSVSRPVDPLRTTMRFGVGELPPARDPLRTTQVYGSGGGQPAPAPAPAQRPSTPPAPTGPAVTSQTLLEVPLHIPASLAGPPNSPRAPQAPAHAPAGEPAPGAPSTPGTRPTTEAPAALFPPRSSHDEQTIDADVDPELVPSPPPALIDPAFTRSLAQFEPSDELVIPRSAGDEFEPLVPTRRRSSRWPLLALVALALAVVGGLVYQRLASRAEPPPQEAIAAHEAALRALRRDDAVSLQAASQQLASVAGRWPAYAEARVSHLVALLFRMEDVQIRAALIDAQVAQLDERLERLRTRQQPFDWAAQVDSLEDARAKLAAQGAPLVQEEATLRAEVEHAWTGLNQRPLPEQDAQQWARAQAIYGGVMGTEQGLRMSEQFRTLGGTGGWSEVAFAEYALNARVAPESWRQARRELETARKADSSWTRLYVMIGRLALKERDIESALTAFESARTLNGEHDTARLLLEHTRQLRGQLALER